MSYAIVRDALLATLQGASGFDSSSVAYEDYAALDGGATRAVVVSYNGFTDDYLTFGPDHSRKWSFRLQLYTAFADIVGAQAQQDADRQALLDQLALYPLLGGTAGVLNVNAVSGKPLPGGRQLGDISFLQEDLSVDAWEDVPRTALE
jgi:hypothetical protein